MNALGVISATILLMNPVPNLEKEQAFCLAEAIYWEARDVRIPIKDKVLIANTVIHSAEKRGITFCEEIQRKGRYPWTKNKNREILLDNSFEKIAWELAAEIAVLKMTGESLGWNEKPDYFYSPLSMKPLNKIPNFAWNKIVISYSIYFIFLAYED